MTAISVTKARDNVYQILSDVNNNSQPITITNNREKNGVSYQRTIGMPFKYKSDISVQRYSHGLNASSDTGSGTTTDRYSLGLEEYTSTVKRYALSDSAKNSGLTRIPLYPTFLIYYASHMLFII